MRCRRPTSARLPRPAPAERSTLSRVAEAAGQRRELSGDHTVVGLFGVTGPGNSRRGLILLDLPDFDSVRAGHREIATRLAGQVNVLVRVTDPENYADSVIHDHFIRPHPSHGAVTLAVLNKSDRLSGPDRQVAQDSLAQLLREDGLKKASVIATSARDGSGAGELRTAIALA